jgi:hypothetical protein
MDELRGIIPQRWVLPTQAVKYEQLVVINWLQVEVDQDKIATMPTLQHLTRWRNREVFWFIRNEWPDWTARVC